MKKLIMSLATVSLMTGSLANVTAFVNQKPPVANKPKTSGQATNEDAEDIANKIWNKTVKIDPNFWLNKDIKSDQADFNKALVKDVIITQDEAHYVSWGSFNINKAGWFANQGAFTVTKDGATATGNVTIDATVGETTAQIAAKITKSNLRFNYNYWNQKAVGKYLSQVQAILANEKVLTKAEASVVTGLKSPVTITKTGMVAVVLNLNDNKTSSSASAKVNVVNDGDSAQQIAGKVNGYGYGLKTNVAGQYADASYVINNWHNLLQDVYGVSSGDASALSLPHVKLAANNNNVQAFATKDGQIFTATVNLECKTNPYIYYYQEGENDIVWYLNISPSMRHILQSYFPSNSSQDDLGYFYNMLDDGNDDRWLPDYSSTEFITWPDVLEDNMNSDFCEGTWPTQLLGALDNLSYRPGNTAFENALYGQIMNGSGYLSMEVDWNVSGQTSQETTYDIAGYGFW